MTDNILIFVLLVIVPVSLVLLVALIGVAMGNKGEELPQEGREALDHLRVQAHRLVESVEGWIESAARLSGSLPDDNYQYNFYTLHEPWERFFEGYVEVAERGHAISHRMTLLREYSRSWRPALPAAPYDAFESLDRACTRSYLLLWQKLGQVDLEWVRQLRHEMEAAGTARKGISRLTLLTLRYKGSDQRWFTEVRQSWGEVATDLAEAAEAARGVPLRECLDAFDREAQRIIGTRADEGAQQGSGEPSGDTGTFRQPST